MNQVEQMRQRVEQFNGDVEVRFGQGAGRARDRCVRRAAAGAAGSAATAPRPAAVRRAHRSRRGRRTTMPGR